MRTILFAAAKLPQPVTLSFQRAACIVHQQNRHPTGYRQNVRCVSNSPYVHSVRTNFFEEKTGKTVKFAWERPETFGEVFEVARAEIDLPPSPIKLLGNLWPRRDSTALAMGPPDLLDERRMYWLQNADVVIFGHGLTQQPENYASTLQRLVAVGYVVIAPRTSILSVLFPWQMVETKEIFSTPLLKLETAMLIDIARSVQMVKEAGAASVQLLGHNMGSTSLLKYIPFLPHEEVASILLLAPLPVKDSTEIVKPKHIEGNANIFKNQTPLLILQGEKDMITKKKDTEIIFEGFAKKSGFTGLGVFPNGNHIGFEDTLYVNIPFLNEWQKNFAKILFEVIKLLLFSHDVFGMGTKAQKTSSKVVIETFFKNSEKPEKILQDILEKAVPEDKVYYRYVK